MRLPPVTHQPLWFLCVLLPGLLFLFPSAWAEEGPEAPASRFERIVAGLEDASPGLRAEFAAIALSELSLVYLAEADLAKNESRDESANRAKLLGWSHSVERYALDLMALGTAAEEGARVEMSLSPQGLLTVTVDRNRIMLTHPRARQQPAYESLVLADFCLRRDCASFSRIPAEQDTPIPVSAATVSPLWSFSGGGALCEYNGLVLSLEDTGNLGWGRSVCQQFMEEAQLLQTEIAWQRLQGVKVHWAGLSAIVTPGGREHLLQLNGSGDAVLVSIPLIYSTPGLLEQLTPWLRGPSAAGALPQLNFRARDYGWEPGQTTD